jgi:basic membrane protein A
VAPAIGQLADEFPQVHFVQIDSVTDKPNVQSVLFKEEEGSFLVGALAAMKSRTGVIGFVGGMDSELIRKFGCGYMQGANAVNPRIQVLTEMIGGDVTAFFKPDDGRRIAEDQVKRGADVLYAAAGVSGDGVLDAARDRGVLGIGVDINQDGRAPGKILTSMLVRLDVAVYSSLDDALAGRWKPGVRTLGLKEGGVDWSLDQDNILLVDEAMEGRILDFHFAIIAGQLRVHRYSPADGCPYYDFDAKKPLKPTP